MLKARPMYLLKFTDYLAFCKMLWGDKLYSPQKEKLLLFFQRITPFFVSIITTSTTTCQHSLLSTPAHSGGAMRTLLPELFSSYITNAPSIAVDLSQLNNLFWAFLFNPVINTQFHLHSSIPACSQLCSLPHLTLPSQYPANWLRKLPAFSDDFLTA